jgi:hypothetical protein
MPLLEPDCPPGYRQNYARTPALATANTTRIGHYAKRSVAQAGVCGPWRMSYLSVQSLARLERLNVFAAKARYAHDFLDRVALS